MNATSTSSTLIALGGNLPSDAGPPGATLRAALAALPERHVRILDVSTFYATPCFPEGAGPDYVNAAARVGFDGSAQALLAVLHDVEALFGRARVARWGRRTLDLDLLAMGQTVLPDPETHAAWRTLPADRQVANTPDQLIVPHPRLAERAFVLVPLMDVAPGWVHPVTGASVREMVQALPEQARKEVIPL